MGSNPIVVTNDESRNSQSKACFNLAVTAFYFQSGDLEDEQTESHLQL
jgi:hypothetical protein